MPGGMNSPYNRQKAVGGGVPDAPRRGQDPSLQATLKGVRKAACPQAAAGVSGWLPVDGRPRKARRNPSGLASSASPSDPNPSVASRHLPAQRGVTPLRGAPFARAKPAREASPSGEVAAEQAGRVQPVDGGHSKVAGRACPAPTDCRESLCTRGAREGGSPPLPSWRVVDREWAATQGPSESPSPLTRPAPFDKGASLAPCGGSGEHPNFKTEEGSAALRTDSNTASV